MSSVLLISNVELDDAGGRAEKFAWRVEKLDEHGFDVRLGHVPEPYVLTFVPAILRCLWTVYREDVDVINSVSNPFHLQLVGFVVATLTGLPWVVEFRDPMVESPDRDPDALVTRIARIVERLVVASADRVVWGDGIQIPDDYFTATYDVDPSKVTKLPFHGYDPEVFESTTPRQYDAFTITYAGSFYDGWIEPFRFLEGLALYADATGDRDLRVQFYGDWSDAYDDAVESAGVGDLIETHAFVPHDEIVPVLTGSDCLLYVGGDDPRNRLNVPSKIWDYVGARRPILAVVDPSFRVARLIEEYDLGVVAAPEPEAIRDALLVLGESYEYDPDEEVFERFTRERKLDRLVEVLSEMVDGTS